MTTDAMTAPATATDVPDAKPGTGYIAFAAAGMTLASLWASAFLTAEQPLTTFAGFILIQLLVVSVFTDLSRRRIPNWATYPTFVLGLAVNVVAYLFPTWAEWLGAVGLTQSLSGGFGLLLIMFVIFSISGGGAGDIKLAACLGALLGWDTALDAMLYSFIVAGAGMLCYSIWRDGPLFIFNSFGRSILHKLMPQAVDPPAKNQSELLNKKFPLAPFFACGTALALYWS